MRVKPVFKDEGTSVMGGGGTSSDERTPSDERTSSDERTLEDETTSEDERLQYIVLLNFPKESYHNNIAK